MNRWCYWKDDGAPVRCRACEEPGATIAREFNLKNEYGRPERGLYHEECAEDLWGADWRTQDQHPILYDGSLMLVGY